MAFWKSRKRLQQAYEDIFGRMMELEELCNFQRDEIARLRLLLMKNGVAREALKEPHLAALDSMTSNERLSQDVANGCWSKVE